MSIQELNLISPLASPLPPPPEGEILTPEQWTTLLAIGDTIIPAIESSSNPSSNKLALSPSEYTSAVETIRAIQVPSDDKQLVQKYLGECSSSIPALKELLHRTLHEYIRPDARSGIAMILSALNSKPGCLLTTGYITPFHLQPVHVRQQILQSWSNSYLPPLRNACKGLSSLFRGMWLKTSPTYSKILGMPRAPVHGTPGDGFEYDFLQFPPGDEPEIVETDVVIVGSGCGGGVCAKNLAEAGNKVIVVDRAYYFPPKHLPMSELDGQIHLFQNGGVDVSDDGSISILAGQAWGGGGTINWSASLQTQGYVRQEWADGGLPFFTSTEFQNSLDRVCDRMGVSTDHIHHNPQNQSLLEGARRLGYSAKAVPQNTGGKQHYCGYCSLGCGSAEKQGPTVSFLPDAARAGAHFIEGYDAREVMFEKFDGRKTAVGVRGTWTSRDSNGGVGGSDRHVRQVVIKAKRTIVSSGSLQSPLLLLRSGLVNPQIGRNLHLHPVGFVLGVFPETRNPWEGGILTAVSDSFQDLDGRGHGPKLEAAAHLPSLVLPLAPWTSGPAWKALAAKFKNAAALIALARDRDAGRVYPDPRDGRCRVAYSPSAFDRRSVLEGVLALARICYVAGAREIVTATAGVPSFVRGEAPAAEPDPGINDPDFQAWLLRVRRKGLPSPDASFGTAHQMGSCRMGPSERCSVVDPEGKVWGTEGLFVADASVFPSASGVNPMVTNMAISDWISRGIAKGIKKEEWARL